MADKAADQDNAIGVLERQRKREMPACVRAEGDRGRQEPDDGRDPDIPTSTA
jgi:hypothetical protein